MKHGHMTLGAGDSGAGRGVSLPRTLPMFEPSRESTLHRRLGRTQNGIARFLIGGGWAFASIAPVVILYASFKVEAVSLASVQSWLLALAALLPGVALIFGRMLRVHRYGW